MISERFGLEKLHKHSHLFTSDTPIEFPGRRFRIVRKIPYTRKEMRAGIDFEKANVTTRNFPESVESLRKRWKIKDGGSLYAFFTTVGKDEKMMLLCEKFTE